MQISKVLVPVDGSEERSVKAVAMAVQMAQAFGAELRLLTSYEPMPGYLERAKELEEHLLQSAKEIVSTHYDELDRQNVEWEERILVGGPVDVIVGEAQHWGADLIVMASTHKSDLAGLVLGSVTHGVLHIDPCPVLVV